MNCQKFTKSDRSQVRTSPPATKRSLVYSKFCCILRRKKRSTTSNPNMKKSCSLYIQTDPLFWLHIKKHEKDDHKIEEEILSLIAQHVKAVNRIYSDTAFQGKKMVHTGYQFQVRILLVLFGNFNSLINLFCC